MKNFVYHAPVMLHIGKQCIQANADYIQSCGNRAFVLTSKFAPGYKNQALEDMLEVFCRTGISYQICDEVEENPSVESVAAITAEIRFFKPDFLVAIGGGSALDTAKAANVLLKYSKDRDPYDAFYHGVPAPTGSPSSGLLPLLGVPTTAGSGSEVAGYAVLTRTDTKTKLRMNQLSFFTAAFLDAQYIMESPQWLLDSGALDALAHGIEGYVNVASNPYNRLLSDYGFRLFASFKDRLLSGTMTYEDYEKMLVAASVQGMAVMQSSTTLPHGMGYPLTHFKDISHGFASSITLGAYLKIFSDRHTIRRIVNKCGFRDVDELSAYIAALIERNNQFKVSEREIRQWTNDFCKIKQRLDRHPEPVTKEQIYEIYRSSLERYLVEESEADAAMFCL